MRSARLQSRSRSLCESLRRTNRLTKCGYPDTGDSRGVKKSPKRPKFTIETLTDFIGKSLNTNGCDILNRYVVGAVQNRIPVKPLILIEFFCATVVIF